MKELTDILRYLHSRVPMTSQAEHDAIAAHIEALAPPAAPTQETES